MNFLTQYQRHPSLDPYVSACQSTDSFGVVYRAHEMYTFFLSLHGSLTDAFSYGDFSAGNGFKLLPTFSWFIDAFGYPTHRKQVLNPKTAEWYIPSKQTGLEYDNETGKLLTKEDLAVEVGRGTSTVYELLRRGYTVNDVRNGANLLGTRALNGRHVYTVGDSNENISLKTLCDRFDIPYRQTHYALATATQRGMTRDFVLSTILANAGVDVQVREVLNGASATETTG